jgi:hypothetical protein
MLTIYNLLHILDKAMDNLEGLRCGHLSLILSKSTQPLEYRFNVLLSKQPLDKFFCIASGEGIQYLTKDGLTWFSLLDFLGHQRKCGEKLHEYLDNYLGHGDSGRDLGIDVEAVQKLFN